MIYIDNNDNIVIDDINHHFVSPILNDYWIDDNDEEEEEQINKVDIGVDDE